MKTTMRYLHHKSRAGEAALLAEAFSIEEPDVEETMASKLEPVNPGGLRS